jgi:hypothetical protein
MGVFSPHTHMHAGTLICTHTHIVTHTPLEVGGTLIGENKLIEMTGVE